MSEADRFLLQSSSNGNQRKWVSDNKYIKADIGYESIAEFVAYIFSKHTSIKSIRYTLCRIEEGKDRYFGCYSKNFLRHGESLITVHKILKKYLGVSGINILYYNRSDKILDIVVRSCSRYTMLSEDKIYNYFSDICKFDAIILNEDRHLNNIAFIFDGSTYRTAPIFDNGDSLLSGYALDECANGAELRVNSKPFASNFEQQIQLFRNRRKIKVDINKLLSELNSIELQYKQDEYNKACQVLLYRLKQTENIIWECC